MTNEQNLCETRSVSSIDPLSSEFIWVWNDVEKSWMVIQGCCAAALWKTFPKRYEWWRPYEEISVPPSVSLPASIDFDQTSEAA